MRNKWTNVLSLIVFCLLFIGFLIMFYFVDINEHPEQYEQTPIEEKREEETSVEIETYLSERYEVKAAPEKIVDVDMAATTQHWLYELCEEKGVDFYIVMAMIAIESNYNPDAVNDYGTCVGYMQVNPDYHSMGMDITAPCSNLLAGVSLMERLLTHSGWDYTWALNAYNGGGAYADEMKGDTAYSIFVKEKAEELRP